MVKRIVGLIFIVCIAGGLYFAWVTHPTRQTTIRALAVIGNATVVVRWDVSRGKSLLLVLPQDFEIEAVHGYGQYRLDALWNLDQMDHRKGDLFLTSLSDATAIPVGWYMERSGPVGAAKEDIVHFVSSVLSLRVLVGSVFSGKTSMSLLDAVRVWRLVRNVQSKPVDVFDFRNVAVSIREDKPDGSTGILFDKNAYDAVVADSLEDVLVRQERLRIAVYNTTPTVGIGQKAARMLETMGGFIIFVGNDDSLYRGMCELAG